MEDRAETLRRRIALYRRYLEGGVSAELAGHYLREIHTFQAELDQLANEKRHVARRAGDILDRKGKTSPSKVR